MKIYIVKYNGGSYDDAYEVNLFVTDKKSKATKYVKKFNKILKKWTEYYKQYEEISQWKTTRLKDEYVHPYFDRWYSLQNVSRCYCEEIEFR